MKKPRNPFSFKQFTIHHDGASLPVTTDACLFGALAEFENPEHILDLGTGTGLLLHFMAQKYPNAHLTGIDIHEESLACAKKNFELNSEKLNLTKRTHLIHGDFLSNKIPTETNTFDCIISNPPFFENQLKSQNSDKSISRHFNTGEMKLFFERISILLEQHGTAWILLPNDMDYSKILLNQGLFIAETIEIHAKLFQRSHLIILVIKKISPQQILTKSLTVRNIHNNYSSEFFELMKPYYLNF